MRMERRDIAIISAIIVAGVAIRLLPNILYYAWGNDYGIYYYLSEAFLSGNALAYPPSSPWGTDGYQYFPMTYIIVDLVHYATRLPVNISLDYSIPILGGLTPFLVYAISREVGFDKMTSALVGFLLVVSPIQLYQTSQPNYLTTGHFFLLLSVYFFLAYHRKRVYALPMAVSIVLLVLSHQLSTYFFLISIIGMVFTVNLFSTRWKKKLFSDMMIIELSGTLMIAYLLLRVPDMVSFFSKAIHGLGYGAVVAIFYALVIGMFILLTRVDSERVKGYAVRAIERMKLEVAPKRDVGLVFVAAFALVVIFAALKGTGIIPAYISYSALIISLPFLVFISVSVIGIKYFLVENNVYEVLGWSMAIMLSLLYSFASKNTVLLPARNIEYLSEPFCIIAGYVLIRWYHHFRVQKSERGSRVKQVFSGGQQVTSAIAINSAAGVNIISVPRVRTVDAVRHVTYSARRPVENVVVIAAVSLVLLMGVASYPMVSDFVPSHSEAITLEDNATIQYLVAEGNRSLSVATDHQIGILLYSYGFSSPFNNVSVLWNSTSWHSAINEITGDNGSYAPIGYVFLNSYMLRYGVWGYNSTFNPNEPPIFVNGSSFTKFFKEPFILAFENSSITTNSTTYLFEVNWTYLGEKGYNLSYYEGLYNNRTSSPPATQLSPISQASGQTTVYFPSLSPPSPCSPFQQRQRPYLQPQALPPPV